MTREEIKAEFQVDDAGVIRSPGKFEAEMIYAPYFYDKIMEGGGDERVNEDGSYSTFFGVTGEDKAEFPELKDIQVVECYESDRGFFCVEADKA